MSFFLLSVFADNSGKSIVLTDIKGTLLQSYLATIKNDTQKAVAFMVNAGTLVTNTVENNITHIDLIENKNANKNIKHTINIITKEKSKKLML
ncbi:MAG: hypothetical protein CR989_01665 [Flavobacteriales bacterium]|nr:MAG: hypothetical protein CR989_01665 [Flavobacteriales bacterium]